jgi:triphosphoribosyl-dephospho-CoA synthase
MHNDDFIAGCAELAMLLEVSATPKPGNVDRTHDFQDVTYEHFLASAVGIFPVFKKAASARYQIGDLILDGVNASSQWQKAGNCHFGAILLLIPLCVAAGNSSRISQLRKNVVGIVKNTTSADAVQFYKSFHCVDVRVQEHHFLDVKDPKSLETILNEDLTLYRIMQISSPNDTLAREWVEGFPRTFHGSQLMKQYVESGRSVNDSIVRLFLKLLGEFPDTLIAKKWGMEAAREVSTKARDVMRNGDVQDFDRDLVQRKINPGTTADLVIASLFVTLLGGFRY